MEIYTTTIGENGMTKIPAPVFQTLGLDVGGSIRFVVDEARHQAHLMSADNHAQEDKAYLHAMAQMLSPEWLSDEDESAWADYQPPTNHKQAH